ncbi:MAG: DUF817 domain-containing protein [Marinovum sp.]|nr:DUF817 domain-containing protein [Marinovum sp.]
MTSTRSLERRLGDATRALLPAGIAEFVMFLLKQGWACIFGFGVLAGLIVTDRMWQEDWAVARYDALLLYAIALQTMFLVLRLETWREVRVILLFHLTGTVMEIFKVNAGSWAYPELGIFKVFGVPLFSGFMYAAVGSYIARVIRIFDMRFAPYPPFWMTVVLASAIYLNFFAHHFILDSRYVLMVTTVVLFARTRIWYFIGETPRWMPLPVAAFLAACALYAAENIGQATNTWVYAGHTRFDWVSPAKMGSWYLLLYVSFVTVTLVVRDHLSSAPVTPTRATIIPGSTGQKPQSG